MMTILSALLGLFTSAVPEVLAMLKRKQDNRQEIEILKLQSEAKQAENLWRSQELGVAADTEEEKTLATTGGSELHETLSSMKGTKLPAWVQSLVAIGSITIDFFTRMIRPTITIAVFGFYIFYKIQNNLPWGEEDWSILFLVLGYWFGHRALNKYRKGEAK